MMFLVKTIDLWRHGGEWIFQVVERLRELGAYSLPGDGCECLYLEINEFVTIVYRVFA